jgi:hypothetical protein
MEELMPQLSSYLIGTVGLLLLLAASAGLTVLRPRLNPEIGGSARFCLIVVLSVLAQAAHFIEEFLTRFFVRFPEVFGLQPWSETFFVSFNVVWLGLWVLALVGVRAGIIIAVLPLWFLGLAMVLNVLAHPVLALIAGGYFPGLLTAPLVGALGLLLVRELVRVTTPAKTTQKYGAGKI